MDKINSFLVINPYGIGDVLFTTPVIRSIKAHDPNSRIYYLCNRRTVDILKDHPDITGVFVYDRDDFQKVKVTSLWAWVKKWLAFFRQIRKEKISVALDFSLNTGIGAIPFFSGISRRIGLNYKKRGRFLTESIPIVGFEGKHVAEHYLMVLPLLGIPQSETGLTIGMNTKAYEWAQAFFHDHGIYGNDRVIGIAPCGGEAFGPQAYLKRWPEKNFIQVINVLTRDVCCKVLLFAGPGEKEEIGRIMSGLDYPDRCFPLAQTTLVQCVPLIDRCDLFISNDTGLLRFADALKKKIIAFFGPVDEQVYGLFPYDLKRHRYMSCHIPCRPCYQKFRVKECTQDQACLKNVSVDRVLGAVDELMPANR